MLTYLNDPDEIYRRSFETIREEVDLDALPKNVQRVAERVIHSCGMIDVFLDLRVDEDLPDAVAKALTDGKPILADCEMVRAAIIARFLPAGTNIICTLNDPEAATRGKKLGVTRSAAAVSLWREHLDGAVVVIGNAPTALFTLLEMLDHGAPRPAAIIAFPVGFIGAAESKAELDRDPRGAAIATLLGRRGGSAMAAAALNAITSAL